MKQKLIALFTLALLAAFSLTGCGRPTPLPLAEQQPAVEPAQENYFTRVRLVDIFDDQETLLLAGDGVYLTGTKVPVIGDVELPAGAKWPTVDVPVYLDGKEADASVLERGMTLDIEHGGVMLPEDPAWFGQVAAIHAYSRGTQENPMGTYYDLCGLYLRVLDDLWEKDAGLNGDAVFTSVDLSEAPGDLTDAEKAAVAYAFSVRHGTLSLRLTYDELLEGGYLAEVTPEGAEHPAYMWEDGVLFRIRASEDSGSYSLSIIHFNAEKWRSPLGAYFLSDCTAAWPENGTWESYSIGSEAIS